MSVQGHDNTSKYLGNIFVFGIFACLDQKVLENGGRETGDEVGARIKWAFCGLS